MRRVLDALAAIVGLVAAVLSLVGCAAGPATPCCNPDPSGMNTIRSQRPPTRQPEVFCRPTYNPVQPVECFTQ